MSQRMLTCPESLCLRLKGSFCLAEILYFEQYLFLAAFSLIILSSTHTLLSSSLIVVWDIGLRRPLASEPLLLQSQCPFCQVLCPLQTVWYLLYRNYSNIPTYLHCSSFCQFHLPLKMCFHLSNI